jgi:hypothetical protein
MERLPVRQSLVYEVSKSRFTCRKRTIQARAPGLCFIPDVPCRPPVATGSARPVSRIVSKTAAISPRGNRALAYVPADAGRSSPATSQLLVSRLSDPETCRRAIRTLTAEDRISKATKSPTSGAAAYPQCGDTSPTCSTTSSKAASTDASSTTPSTSTASSRSTPP